LSTQKHARRLTPVVCRDLNAVVLDAVLWLAHPACLRCHWFDASDHYMKAPGQRLKALVFARRHETSDGTFSGDDPL
jgi:hypothetical protein